MLRSMMLQHIFQWRSYASVAVFLCMVEVTIKRARWSDSSCINVSGWKNIEVLPIKRIKGEIFKTTSRNLTLGSLSFLIGKEYLNWTPLKMSPFFKGP